MAKLSIVGTFAALAITAGTMVFSGTLTTSLGEVRLETMVEGLDVPWGFAFVPEGGVLITEREGALYSMLRMAKPILCKWRSTIIRTRSGRAGRAMLDIMLPHDDFTTTRDVFLTYSKRQGRGAGTAVAKGRLSEDARHISNVTVIFEATPSTNGGRHFGSRSY